MLQYLVAFLVLLSTVKLWHLFRVNPKMNVFTATLERAWSDMSGFLLIVVLLLVAYSTAVSTHTLPVWKEVALTSRVFRIIRLTNSLPVCKDFKSELLHNNARYVTTLQTTLFHSR